MQPHDDEPVPAGARPPGNRKRTVAITLTAMLLVCCGGAIAVGYSLVGAVDEAADPMRTAAMNFLTDLKNHNYASAYGRLCPRTRETWTSTRFTSRQVSHPLVDFVIVGVYPDDRTGQVDGRVTASLTYADRQHEQRALPMVVDHGSWYVCGDPF
jgi:hypothetical protein